MDSIGSHSRSAFRANVFCFRRWQETRAVPVGADIKTVPVECGLRRYSSPLRFLRHCFPFPAGVGDACGCRLCWHKNATGGVWAPSVSIAVPFSAPVFSVFGGVGDACGSRRCCRKNATGGVWAPPVASAAPISTSMFYAFGGGRRCVRLPSALT